MKGDGGSSRLRIHLVKVFCLHKRSQLGVWIKLIGMSNAAFFQLSFFCFCISLALMGTKADRLCELKR